MLTILYMLLAPGLFGADWPQLRGPNGSGLCPLCGKLPTEFGPQKNVLWKTELAPGKSSPVLVEDRIFLTASEGDDLITICLSRTTGKVQWQRSVRAARREAQHTLNHRAAPTPVTDGKSVFVFFADFGLVAYDFEGKQRWQLPLGPFNSQHGSIRWYCWGTPGAPCLPLNTRFGTRSGSRMILLNPAPASTDHYKQLRKEWLEKRAVDMDRRKAIAESDAYKEGDPDAVTAYYRIHFRPALARPADFEKIIARFRSSFTKEGILKARAIESRLMDDTWSSPEYDLLPKLKSLRIPTLVMYGDHDFIPAATAEHITQAIPNARLVTLKDCGHFSYLECPVAVREHIDTFFHGK